MIHFVRTPLKIFKRYNSNLSFTQTRDLNLQKYTVKDLVRWDIHFPGQNALSSICIDQPDPQIYDYEINTDRKDYRYNETP